MPEVPFTENCGVFSGFGTLFTQNEKKERETY
jgi:hypothetical protein